MLGNRDQNSLENDWELSFNLLLWKSERFDQISNPNQHQWWAPKSNKNSWSSQFAKYICLTLTSSDCSTYTPLGNEKLHNPEGDDFCT